MPFKNVIKLKEIGLCFGVTRAINIVKEAINDPSISKPIYLLGDLAHNTYVSNYFKSNNVIVIEGAKRFEMIDLVPNNSSVVFTAHGVSKQVVKKALKKNLKIIDSTCPFVKHTVDLVEKAINDGYDVLFLGKAHHPETESILGLDNNKIHLIGNDLIIDNNISNNKIALAHQTTYSSYDVNIAYNKIKEIYPNIKLLDMICKVTEFHQNALEEILKLGLVGKNLVLVIGDKKSNNSSKLFEKAQRLDNFDSLFISSISELNLFKAKEYDNVVLASGTSTPISLVNEIYDVLNNIDNYDDEYIQTKINENNII